jgi:hypothetical protein
MALCSTGYTASHQRRYPVRTRKQGNLAFDRRRAAESWDARLLSERLTSDE